MTKNPILEELHAVREELLVDAGGTLDALVGQLQAEEKTSSRPRDKTRRTKDFTEATNSAVSDGESSPAAQ